MFDFDICFRRLEENLLELACLLPGDDVEVLRRQCFRNRRLERYNPLTVLNMAMMNDKMQCGRFLMDEIRLKFGGAAGRFTFEES